MKKTKMSKKLTLNKLTITDLGKNDLSIARGGAATAQGGPGCDTGVCQTPASQPTWCVCLTPDYCVG